VLSAKETRSSARPRHRGQRLGLDRLAQLELAVTLLLAANLIDARDRWCVA
jgi:hypothetical protein